MTFNLVIPELNSKPKNTKDAVINILSSEWPLSLKKIFYQIKKQYNYSNTYQSVYKAVKELMQAKVLKEVKDGYEINVDWVKKVQSFTDIIETNYFAKKKFNHISGINNSKHEKDLVILDFKTLFDAEKYLYYFMKTELLKKKDENVVYQIKNEWRPFFYLRAEANFYKKLMKHGHKFYFLYEGNSELEELAKKFYKAIGVKVNGIKNNFSYDTIVFLDYFIQIFLPEELKEKIKSFLETKNILGLLDLLNKEFAIKVIINKDESLANEVIKNTLKKFK